MTFNPNKMFLKKDTIVNHPQYGTGVIVDSCFLHYRIKFSNSETLSIDVFDENIKTPSENLAKKNKITTTECLKSTNCLDTWKNAYNLYRFS